MEYQTKVVQKAMGTITPSSMGGWLKERFECSETFITKVTENITTYMLLPSVYGMLLFSSSSNLNSPEFPELSVAVNLNVNASLAFQIPLKVNCS